MVVVVVGGGSGGGTVRGQIKLWKAVERLQCASGCCFSPPHAYLYLYALSYTAVPLLVGWVSLGLPQGLTIALSVFEHSTRAGSLDCQ